MGFRRHKHQLDGSPDGKKQFLIIVGVAILIIFILCILPIDDNTSEEYEISNINNNNEGAIIPNIPSTPECSDGTDYNSCSSNRPNYCLEGNLIEKPETCGCAYEFVWILNECVSIYKTNPKEIDLNYTLRGEKGSVDYTVYRGLNDYLANLERTVTYYDEPPTDEEMELRFITEEHQSEYISPLVNKIKQITDNSDDQARIAINMVQTIPYDWDAFNNDSVTGRYPYETIYDQTGVCGEKSLLLALMLKELGYGVVLFSFSNEQHETVGIKCPIEYSYLNSGYCFIESTTPSIVTDAEGDYIGTGELISIPDIYVVSDGKSFDSVTEEANDYTRLQIVQAKLDTFGSGKTLSSSKYREWKKYYDEWLALTKKYGFIFDD